MHEASTTQMNIRSQKYHFLGSRVTPLTNTWTLEAGLLPTQGNRTVTLSDATKTEYSKRANAL
jgi:nitrogen fixation protein